MRRLLIKLVAVQTALLGWLSYWLFLVYANNPIVSEQLANNLQRFPQLSFTTVDIAVLSVIAVFSIIIAFKFHRGLKPGIRLERALQMLENLMKRNLILEAQVADLKVEKTQTPQQPPVPPSTPPQQSEPRAGSWENAFRIPLEAGPTTATTFPPRSSEDNPFDRRAATSPPLPPRIEAKPPIIIPEKTLEKPITVTTPKLAEKSPEASSNNTNWEDSPKYVGESKRILTPSQPPRKNFQNSESTSFKQPYIPAPAPKTIPPSVIIGGLNQSQVRTMIRPLGQSQIPQHVSPNPSTPRASSDQNKSTSSSAFDADKEAPMSGVTNVESNQTLTENKATDDKPSGSNSEKENASESEESENTKMNRPTKKKFPYEDDD